MDTVRINAEELLKLIGLKEVMLMHSSERVEKLERELRVLKGEDDAPSRDTSGSNVPRPKDNGRT